MSELRKAIAALIYEADWEIRGGGLDDISEFYMIDEAEVVKTIIEAVREAPV